MPGRRTGALSTAQKRAYVIADSQLALDAGWNEECWHWSWPELSEAGYDWRSPVSEDAGAPGLAG